jgi:putative ABC transport system permease protein
VNGRYPTGPAEIALTNGAAIALNKRLGDALTAGGRTRRVVGIVENPLDLADDFALVVPGQAKPPTQISLLLNGSDQRLNAFRPHDGLGIEHRSSAETAAEVVVLVLETVSLLFVGLLAAAGFAVMAQRRLRALGMLGALGATDRDVRFAMIANGAAVGVVAALAGAALGLAGWIAIAPSFVKIAGHRVDRFNLPWWAIAAAIALAIVAAVAAAWWPARAGARASIVAALSGRPSPPKPAHRFATLGLAVLAGGVVSLTFANRLTTQAQDGRRLPNTPLIIFGTIATTIGMLALGPLLIRFLASVGRRATISLRLALRDLARYQARSAAALAAISLALAIAATIAISAAAAISPATGGNLPANELFVHLTPTNGNIDVNGQPALAQWNATQLATIDQLTHTLAGTLHARAVIPLTQAFDPQSGTNWGPPPDAPGPAGQNSTATPSALGTPSAYVIPVSLGAVSIDTNRNRSGYNVANSSPLYVATPELLQHYGIDRRVLDTSADIITSRNELAGLTITSPSGERGSQRANTPTGPRTPTQRRPTIQHVNLPTYTSGPNTLLTPHAIASFGLQSSPAGWLVATRHALTHAQIAAAQHAAAGTGVAVETRPTQATLKRLRDDATAIGILVALGVLAMTVGLIRSETANELRTLTAAGASNTTRRNITAATAGALAILGALLGIAVAYLASIAWHSKDLHPLTRVPTLDLAVVLVGLPVLAFGGGWLLAGREPTSIAHQPLE